MSVWLWNRSSCTRPLAFGSGVPGGALFKQQRFVAGVKCDHDADARGGAVAVPDAGANAL